MKNIFKSIILLGLIGVSMTMSAQKIAVVNTDTILRIMPEYKAAETKIQELQIKKQKELLATEKEIQTKIQEFYKSEKSTTTSKAELDIKRQTIQDAQSSFEKQKQAVQQFVQEQQQAMMAPIVKKLKVAIDVVAKQNGFQYVSSKEVFLTIPENSDITLKVIKFLKL